MPRITEIKGLKKKIETFNDKNGILRKKEMLRLIASIKGECFVYNSQHKKERRFNNDRDIITFILVYFCHLSTDTVSDYYGLSRNTCYMGLKRLENKLDKSKEFQQSTFEEVNELVNGIRRNFKII